MNVKGKRCGCRDESGRQLGAACPKLRQRHHGSYEAALRIDTSTGRRKLHRSGFESAGARDEFEDQVRELVRLADDDGTRARIGDLIFELTRRGGQLPDAEVVRRRLALGVAPGGSGETFGQAWSTWLAGKKRLRASSRRRLEQIGAHWLLPVLDGVLIERLNAAHCAMVFDRIEDINAEIRAAAAEDRKPELDGDVRARPQLVGVASQHRVYAALRELLNHLWKKRHVIAFNPVYAVELEAEETPEARRWTAAEVFRFLAYCEGRPLGLMFRTVVLRGTRRGEAVGFRWASSDLDAGYLGVERPVLQIGGEIIEGRPKSKAGERRIWLDAGSVKRYRAHRRTQAAERLRASTAWEDNDLIFCRTDGSPWPPDYVSREFKRYAADAGIPVIKMHEGRHSAASLARDAGVDPKIRQDDLGHASAAMTDLYTHVLADAHLDAAERVARLVEEAGA
jgi:integrase